LANVKSAKKRILVSARRKLRNKNIVSAVRTAWKKANTAVIDVKAADKAGEIVREAISKIDRATSKGIVHKNTAARKKSRLMLKLNSLKAEAAK
jgi:small subunit ribosomal protein S20